MLLDQTRNKGTQLLKVRLLLVGTILVALACLAGGGPGIVALASEPESFVEQSPAPPTPPPSHTARTVTTRSSDGRHSRETRIQGDVEFTGDDSDVQAISGNGSFVYQESYGFAKRRYQGTTNRLGQLQRHYFVDGFEKPFDADGKAWMRAALPDVLRDTGINASERVQRILKLGGPRAVIDEIGKIHSEGVKSLYVRELVATASLDIDQLESLLRIVRGMNSDGEKSTVLTSLAPFTLKDGLRDYSFEALQTMHSDGEKHSVLRHYISQDPSRPTLALAARAAEGINSDGERASVLVDLAAHLRGNADLSKPFFRSTQSLHSDGEHARVLMAAIAAAGEQHDTLVDALRSAASLNSGGEKASVLVHADGYWKDDDAMRQAYFDTTKSIHSDGEKARVLTSLVGGAGFSDRTLSDAVHCAAGIHSDGEKARTLIAIANHANGKPAVREQIRTAAASIHSDGEYRRVMNAIGSPVSSVPNRAQTR
jgi:hypothetical protein